MAKKDKAGKKAGKKAKVYEASLIFGIAGKEAEKAGEREYPFLVNDVTHVFKVKANKSKNPKGESCIRKGFMLDGKQITAQASRLLLDTIGRSNGETPEGRAVAKTKPALAAVEAWQSKHGFLVNPPKGEKETSGNTDSGKVDGFKKKEMKIEVKKKDVKKGFGNSYSKKEMKIVLKAFGNEKKITVRNLITAIDGVASLTTEEIKAALPDYF